jgi:thiol-disulfide isomerase/thioredoxin
MRSSTLLAAAMSLAMLGFINTGCARADADPTTLVGKAAPDVSLTTLDGSSAKLSSEKGKVVVLDFWATWCPPCRASLPHTQALSANKDLAAKGLVVWAVDDAETSATVQKFLADNHYTFTVPMDTDQATLKKYLVQGIPTTVVIGRDGMIKNVFVGWDSSGQVGTQIDSAVNAALADKGG